MNRKTNTSHFQLFLSEISENYYFIVYNPGNNRIFIFSIDKIYHESFDFISFYPR